MKRFAIYVLKCPYECVINMMVFILIELFGVFCGHMNNKIHIIQTQKLLTGVKKETKCCKAKDKERNNYICT